MILHKLLAVGALSIASLGVTLTLSDSTPTTTAHAAALRTTLPKSIRGNYAVRVDADFLFTLTKKTIQFRPGYYGGHNKWIMAGSEPKLKVGKSVKFNKTFTINKHKDKKGYWVLRLETRDSKKYNPMFGNMSYEKKPETVRIKRIKKGIMMRESHGDFNHPFLYVKKLSQINKVLK